MKAATYNDVMRAIDQGRLRVSKDGLIEGRRPNPKAIWRRKFLEPVCGPHQTKPYHRVSFVTSEGDRYRVLVHRLVWYVYKGPIPDGLTINHENGDKTDNRLDNLELMTISDNIKHGFQKRLIRPPKAILCDEEVHEARERLATGETGADIARDFGVVTHIINRLGRGETYKHIP